MVTWLDIFLFLKQPVSLLCVPVEFVYPATKANFSFPDPEIIEIPRRTKCTPPNVFNAESTCLINRVIELDAGYPTKCIFVKKQQIVSGADGWSCHYSGTFRPFILPRVVDKPKTRTTSKLRTKEELNQEAAHSQKNGDDASQSDAHSQTSVDTQHTLDTIETDCCPSDEERADDLMFWFSEDESPAPKRRRERKGNATSVPITSRPRVLSAQHDANRTPPRIVMPNVTHDILPSKTCGQ